MTLPVFRPRRSLGRTGFHATLLGIGDIADRAVSVDQLVSTLHRAMDAGLNVIDTAPNYEGGYSEEVVGRALKGRRDAMFVVTKIDHFDRPVADQLEESLQRLQLDHVDGLVFHGIRDLAQWEALTNGPFDELAAVIRSGKARFGGISCHHPEVLRRALPSGLCDIAMFPVGPAVDPRYVDEMLPLAKEHGVGTICFKTFGAGKLLGDTLGYGQPMQARPRGKFGSGGADLPNTPQLPRLDVETCIRYTLTLDPDVALLGMSFMNEQTPALEAASRFVPFSAAEILDVRHRAALAIEGKGGRHWDPQPNAPLV